MRHVKTAVSALAIGLMLVVSIDYLTYAATGDSFILGKTNKASTLTTLQRTTAGPALRLKTTSGAPLKVNSTTRVAKLNADTVDGRQAADLGVNTQIYSFDLATGTVGSFSFTVPNVSAGSYLMTFDGWIYGPSGIDLNCGISNGHLWQRVNAAAGNTFYPMSTSGVVSLDTDGSVVVGCYSDVGSGTWSDYRGIQITLTEITTPTVVLKGKAENASQGRPTR